MVVWLDAGGIDVRPCPNLREERLGGRGERARTIGVFIPGMVPFSYPVKVLRLYEGKAEM